MYTERFVLDKPYFQECFDESIQLGDHNKPKYFLLGLLITLGLFSIYGLEKHYVGNFLILLAVVECLAFYYRRPWWVARQMLSRASGSTVELNIDETQIEAKNPYKHYRLTWQNVDSIIETNKGLVLKSNQRMQYLSNHSISEDTRAFILSQAKK
ncbi:MULTISPECIES: YcxB family protein [unclassified Pseudoalteromonas]|uniref:YcxB family protein n=1 Tax=unclassified Pseudoalteromonas TaxID=194690 RepID=UPI001B3A2323|nr:MULTISPECIES: YcxB family protein [unclassified Pseudoalteromonas]MBQ4844028.1 YcxB family protein [Pseudoalteromonas sp. MMG005]MBQ4852364.1 YcxB family protein [Pseudoalteromonas sp. MMG012]